MKKDYRVNDLTENNLEQELAVAKHIISRFPYEESSKVKLYLNEIVDDSFIDHGVVNRYLRVAEILGRFKKLGILNNSLDDDEQRRAFKSRCFDLDCNEPELRNYVEVMEGKTEKGSGAGKILEWKGLSLNTESGWAVINDKLHQFHIGDPPFKIFKILLEKRVHGKDEGKVTFEEFTEITGIGDKEKTKSTIRELRRALGINRNKNPLEDVFLETGNGYRLIRPESFDR